MFELSQSRLYHMPHNTAKHEELLFLLKKVDGNKKFYTFKELSKLFLIEQIKEGVFEEFHQRPYANLRRINGILYDNFKSNPDLYYDDFINVRYSQTKKWKQIWVEYARDYIDFAAYLGLLPCYYKTPGRGSSSDGYLVSDSLKRFQKDKVSFEEVLMGFKYSNASIDTTKYSQYNISVRPFYLGLKLLLSLEDRGIKEVERKLFYASIACSNTENTNEISSYLVKWIERSGNFLNSTNHDDRFKKEAGRVATGMHDFYKSFSLINETRSGSQRYISISNKGKKLFKSVPVNSLYYGKIIPNSGQYYSPIIARLLYLFSIASKNNKTKIELKELKNHLELSKNKVFDQTVGRLKSLNPSPIFEVDEDFIYLNSFSCQYHVVPYNDFCDENHIRFVYEGAQHESIGSTPAKNVVFPDQNIIDALRVSAVGSDGDKYEEAIYNAFRLLPGECVHYGRAYSGERLSDVVWRVSMPTTDGDKTYLVVVEAKAGAAIRGLNERNIIPQVENTLEMYSSIFGNVDGIWIMICNGNEIPAQEGHGGNRATASSTQLSFDQKLFDIQMRINGRFGRTTLVTAFGIEPFINYYKYLYAKSRATINSNIVDKTYIREFFTYGSLFTNNMSSLHTIIKEGEDLRNLLIYG